MDYRKHADSAKILLGHARELRRQTTAFSKAIAKHNTAVRRTLNKDINRLSAPEEVQDRHQDVYDVIRDMIVNLDDAKGKL